LLRLCAAVPAPRFHTIRYAGVLASAAKLRPKIIPKPTVSDEVEPPDKPPKKKGSRYWPWAERMARSCTTFRRPLASVGRGFRSSLRLDLGNELDVTRCPGVKAASCWSRS
jgi:hypothetical protein